MATIDQRVSLLERQVRILQKRLDQAAMEHAQTAQLQALASMITPETLKHPAIINLVSAIGLRIAGR
ncbi:MAG: hypothetical protein HXM43_09490 [Lautropia mirabilis]|nr:hypothetical protein [Lautropia mirabilis]RKW65439.1 MAG: hypothetical protein D8B51_05770 [Tannerella sp.]